MWTNVTLLSSFIEQCKLLQSFINDTDHDSAALQLRLCTARYRELTPLAQHTHAARMHHLAACVDAMHPTPGHTLTPCTAEAV
jgi:hypothetical protein